VVARPSLTCRCARLVRVHEGSVALQACPRIVRSSLAETLTGRCERAFNDIYL
jgi:hypothetical protein